VQGQIQRALHQNSKSIDNELISEVIMPLTDEQAIKALAAAQAIKDRGPSASSSINPRVFFNNDCSADIRPLMDSSGQFFGTEKRHQIVIPGGNIEVACVDGCRVCSRLAELARWENKWRYTAKEFSFGYGVILRQSGLKADFVRLGEPVILIHKSWDYIISAVMSELGSPERIKEYFNPQNPEYPVTVTIRKSYGKKPPVITVEFDRDGDKVLVPALPSDFPVLTDAVHLKSDSLTVHNFIAKMDADYELALNIKDFPAAVTVAANPVTIFAETPKPEPAVEESVVTANQVDTEPEDTVVGKPVVTCAEADEPDDFESEPHGDCPTAFGYMPAHHAVCNECEAWWDCQHNTVGRSA
jgi:hypothetical protein